MSLKEEPEIRDIWNENPDDTKETKAKKKQMRKSNRNFACLIAGFYFLGVGCFLLLLEYHDKDKKRVSPASYVMLSAGAGCITYAYDHILSFDYSGQWEKASKVINNAPFVAPLLFAMSFMLSALFAAFHYTGFGEITLTHIYVSGSITFVLLLIAYEGLERIFS